MMIMIMIQEFSAHSSAEHGQAAASDSDGSVAGMVMMVMV
jgi:hypothetical protein